MEELAVGSVVLIRFPFSDLRSKKIRPALILARADFGDFIICQITSSPYNHKNSVAVSKGDFASGSLPVDSFVRPDKLFTFSQSQLLKKVGQLNESALRESLLTLKSILQIP